MASYWPSSSFAQARVECRARLDTQSGRSARSCHHRRRLDVPTSRPAAIRPVDAKRFARRRLAGLSFQHGASSKPAQFHGDIFQRMHREIRASFFERGFQFLDEEPLAATLDKVRSRIWSRACIPAVRPVRPKRCVSRSAHVRLPHRESTFAGGDDDLAACGDASRRCIRSPGATGMAWAQSPSGLHPGYRCCIRIPDEIRDWAWRQRPISRVAPGYECPVTPCIKSRNPNTPNGTFAMARVTAAQDAAERTDRWWRTSDCWGASRPT